jgi:parallel beta-helix repeat protein
MLILTGFTTIPVTSTKINTVKPENSDVKKWTFMFYEDEDYTSSWPGPRLWDFVRRSNAFSGENLNIIVLQDTILGPGKMWYITKYGTRKLLKNMGEINMGNYSTLKDFISYCKNNFPAERYIIDLFDHGAAWLGCCWDQTNNHDWLTMDEIQRAITETGGIDIITFFTPCSMASIESVYELRDCVDVYVARQTGARYTKHIVNPLCDLLNNEFHLSNIEIGRKIIDFYEEEIDEYPFASDTFSAIRTDEISNLSQNIHNLSISVLENIENCYDDIRFFYPELHKYLALNGFAEWNQIDIYEFVEKYSKIDDINTTILQECQKIMESFNKTIIAEHHRDGYPNAHGLSINFPEIIFQDIPTEDYTIQNLDFVDDTYWDEFLEAYCSFYITVDSDGGADYICIQDAINNSSDGDIICVKNGVYYENIVINKSLTLVGETYHSTIIDGQRKDNVVEIIADEVNFCTISITNSSIDGAGIYVCSNLSSVRFCSVFNNNKGIFLQTSSENRIHANNVNNNTCSIYLYNSDKNEIFYNIFMDNTIPISFLNSQHNRWENEYIDRSYNPIKIVIGARKIGGISFPCINLDRPHTNSIKIFFSIIRAYLSNFFWY